MVFLVAAAFAIVLAPVARRVGLSAGLVDRGNDPLLNIHAGPVPVLGGAAVLAAAAGALPVSDGPVPATPFIALAVAFAAGMLDDIVSLGAMPRTLALVGAGAILVAGDVRLDAFGPLAVPATIALVLACANGVNFLDGQDGLAAGVAGIAALGLAGLAAGTGGFGVGLGLALAGALTGYLLWNRSPAKMFLGNGGVYALGVCLAALATEASADSGWRGVLGAAVCLGVVAFELVSTVARRARARSPLVRGDRRHSYDVLNETFGSRNAVTGSFWAVSAVLAGLGLAVDSIPFPAGAALAGLSCAIAAIAGERLWGRRAAEVTKE
jgi:UDP-GlcNAc:undecaprenyl-phosphate/decaprenyl-phosphate GlcNAc-1-phosphate transferase